MILLKNNSYKKLLLENFKTYLLWQLTSNFFINDYEFLSNKISYNLTIAKIYWVIFNQNNF